MTEKPSETSVRDYLIEWNYLFPLDKWWREKHGIPLFSKRHLEASQINITYEYLEDKLFDELIEEGKVRKEIDRAYKQGQWLTNRVETYSDKEESDLFDRLIIP
jgi:hypothetical protein